MHYISPGQINILVPDLSPGAVQVQVTNMGSTSAPFTTTTRQYSPAFFLWDRYAVATRLDFSLCAKAGSFSGYTTVPAQPGELVVLWGAGFGPAGVAWGSLTPAGRTYSSAPVTVTIGGVNAAVYGGTAVLSPGFAGLYQVAVQIPASTPNGDALVRAVVGGVQSPDKVYLTVQR